MKPQESEFHNSSTRVTYFFLDLEEVFDFLGVCESALPAADLEAADDLPSFNVLEAEVAALLLVCFLGVPV